MIFGLKIKSVTIATKMAELKKMANCKQKTQNLQGSTK